MFAAMQMESLILIMIQEPVEIRHKFCVFDRMKQSVIHILNAIM